MSAASVAIPYACRKVGLVTLGSALDPELVT